MMPRSLSTRINRRSVRFRTTAGAVLGLVALLAVAGFAINSMVGRALQNALDATLLEQATDRAALIDGGGAIESLMTPVGDEEVVAVVAADGSILASTGVDVGATQSLNPPLGISDIEIAITEVGEAPEQERLRAAAAETSDGLRVVVANENESAESTRTAVRSVLLAVIPLTAVASALVAWFVTGRALHPVRRMQTELDDIVQAGDGQRVSEPGTLDEVDELGTTINAVLGRLDAQSLRQRQFVADASHELKSPLANARAIIETAASAPDQAEYDRVTTSVSTELNRLHSLVDDLLFLARGDEGPPRSPTVADLADLVFDECERVAATSEKRIDASNVAPTDAFVDRAEVARAVRNLIENAERFAVEAVTVSIATAPEWAIVTVSDDGPGIAAQDRALVFERFSRLDGDRGRSVGGTGLGLSIVASIAARSGGSIDVSSSPSGGAHFELRLPRTE